MIGWISFVEGSFWAATTHYSVKCVCVCVCVCLHTSMGAYFFIFESEFVTVIAVLGFNFKIWKVVPIPFQRDGILWIESK